jgi:hypothetical protein
MWVACGGKRINIRANEPGTRMHTAWQPTGHPTRFVHLLAGGPAVSLAPPMTYMICSPLPHRRQAHPDDLAQAGPDETPRGSKWSTIAMPRPPAPLGAHAGVPMALYRRWG